MTIRTRAPSNIALIKYWGKQKSDFNLPLNASLSLTLDVSKIYSETNISFKDSDPSISFTLNNVSSPPTSRLLNLIEIFRAMAPEHSQKGLTITSSNNFPSSAGMASSASGFAAATLGLFHLYGLDLSIDYLTSLARQGSGSACRSFHGGVVEWISTNSSETSIATQLYPQEYWPELTLFLVIVSSEAKEVSSTLGMTQDNPLINERAIERAPRRLELIKEAFAQKDFGTICTVTMEDSDDMHAIAEAGGVFYMNERSHQIRQTVQDFNRTEIRAAYTFDAGPNGFILTLQKDAPEMIGAILQKFRLSDQSKLDVDTEVSDSDFRRLQSSAEHPAELILQLNVSAGGAYQF